MSVGLTWHLFRSHCFVDEVNNQGIISYYNIELGSHLIYVLDINNTTILGGNHSLSIQRGECCVWLIVLITPYNDRFKIQLTLFII